MILHSLFLLFCSHCKFFINHRITAKTDVDGRNGISTIECEQNQVIDCSDRIEEIDVENNLRPKPIPNIMSQVENVKVIIRRNSSPKSPPPPPPTKFSKLEKRCTIEKSETPLPEYFSTNERKSGNFFSNFFQKIFTSKSSKYF